MKGRRDHDSWSAYLFVTLWVSCRRDEGASFTASCTLGMPGAEFCVSSMLYAMTRPWEGVAWMRLWVGAKLEDKEKRMNECRRRSRKHGDEASPATNANAASVKFCERSKGRRRRRGAWLREE